ncbi:oxygen-independent coproporphyrinogen III oxidase [Phaeovulum vinaykumarii]|uniref:Coproporphyrinogen-III oxidase n=1 Tax=Phaeovulum vinaykumarii TaxID=407234 RepID=A0A1N7KSK3_9RHOB|nr:oxygen-independent coproporphyrinogen III oxidase [Phaeovulum vinaykumarii]SIS64527.1 oxygen-independent coproporphyrinogen-3 oxidase [Phaeovulum vinaykumarii]SOC01561.1 oxygen-independent coproporphyrinogen-3 oxidase [Phaeovulum vinaykumarii]
MEQESQLTRLGLFDARVPRYTSYPTAPHFSEAVGATNFVEWVEAIPEGSSISLYMHVPFCRRLCWFCACRTQGSQSDTPVRSYAEVLLTEIALLKKHMPRGVTLSRLHWGGGTPTMLPPDVMRTVAAALFDVAPLGADGEFSVEIDPMECDGPRLDALVESGMNRASIGIQDFDPEIQQIIGREQGYDDTRKAVDMIRERGVTSLNADILYGLPKQSRERISETVQKVLSLTPDRVALYGYAHVPWMARRQTMIPTEDLPSPQERLGLYDTARKLFVWDGYDEIGIDHFARPHDGLSVALKAGKLKRNFQGYTDDQAPVLVGLGASSVSKFPQGYAQNAASTSDYTKAIRAGRFSTHRGHVFTDDDNLRSRMIEALMCDFRIDANEITTTFGISPTRLAEMFDEAAKVFGEMVEITPEGLYIPEKGRPLTRMIARIFDAYDLSKAGHSSAI